MEQSEQRRSFASGTIERARPHSFLHRRAGRPGGEQRERIGLRRLWESERGSGASFSRSPVSREEERKNGGCMVAAGCGWVSRTAG